MKRREFVKQGFSALATLAVGETILLSPNDAGAQSFGSLFGSKKRELYGQRKAGRRPNGKGRLKNDYKRATVVKGVCLTTRRCAAFRAMSSTASW